MCETMGSMLVKTDIIWCWNNIRIVIYITATTSEMYMHSL